jgi:hypothetical protein
MYIGLHVKSSPFFSDFNETFIFLVDFVKNTQISSIIKIHPVEADLFHTDHVAFLCNWQFLYVVLGWLINICKGKGKGHPITAHQGPEGE